jgi:CxC2 like cysteine cluster associated with KDZ transposases
MEHFAPHFDMLQNSILSTHYHDKIGSRCSCGSEPALYKCNECFHPRLLCRTCIISAHLQHPFHNICEWCGTHFERTSLSSLGVALCLGHDGEKCRNRLPRPGRNTVIVHTNGVHQIRIEYCRCKGTPDATQLSQFRLFPATMERPETTFTYAVLNEFHMQSLTSKKSALDFVDTIRKHTSAAFPQETPVSMGYLSNLTLEILIHILGSLQGILLRRANLALPCHSKTDRPSTWNRQYSYSSAPRVFDNKMPYMP